MTDAARRRELALIHAAKKNLALTDESYRAILRRLCNVESSAKLDAIGRQAVLNHFRTLGWDPAKHKAPVRAGARALADDPTARKIRALWLNLWNLGEISDPSEAALAGFVKRQAGVDALQFLRAPEAHKVIDGLRARCARVGFDVPPGVEPIEAMRALLRAQWARLGALGAIKVPAGIGLDSWIHNNTTPRRPGLVHCELDELRLLANQLGSWVRSAAARQRRSAAARARYEGRAG